MDDRTLLMTVAVLHLALDSAELLEVVCAVDVLVASWAAVPAGQA